MKMSPELKRSLATKRNDKIKPTKSRDLCHNDTQRLLLKLSNHILAKGKFFKRQPKADVIVDADCCGTHGLRPVWHGRAS